MPLFLQASLVLMDNSFDVLPEFQPDPLKLLSAIVGRQEELISEAEGLLKQIKLEKYGDAEVKLADVLKENNESKEEEEKEGKSEISQNIVDGVLKIQDGVFDLNKNFILPAVGEALDMEEQKKEGESAFVKIFKMLLSALMFIGILKYAIGGADGFKPDKKNMRMMTKDSRGKK